RADFTAGGKTCSGGSSIIEAPFAAAQSTVARWQAQDVALAKINTASVAPIDNAITSFPRTVLDQANGKIAVAYYNAAANPRFASTTSQDPAQAAYVFGTPLSLNQCSDVHVLPHADP